MRPWQQWPEAHARWDHSTLAQGWMRADDAPMAHLVRNLDNVAWAVLTAVLVITAAALLGFLFLAAI